MFVFYIGLCLNEDLQVVNELWEFSWVYVNLKTVED